MNWTNWSLRRKLTLAGVLVQLGAAAALVFASTQLLQRTLLDQARVETERMIAVLGETIAAPLAQRDYASLQQTLEQVRSDESIRYLVLSNHRGQAVASAGWDASQALPPRDMGDIDLGREDATLHMRAPVAVAGQTLGHIDLGLCTMRMRQARADFLRSSVAVAIVALAISIVLLAAIALAITRHLARLADASQRLAQGDLDVHVPATAKDEIGRLGASFNAMAVALKDRLVALEASETQQQRHLEAAREEQLRMATLLDAMQSGMLLVDPKGEIVYANAAFARLWALPAVGVGQGLAEIIPSLQRQVSADDAAFIESMQDGAHLSSEVHELHTLDGRIIQQRLQPVTQGSHRGGNIWFFRDLTLDRQTQQRARQALVDPLTSLVNRLGFRESLHAALAEAERSTEALTLLFIDLDDFKHANDVGGHQLGDEILVSVSRTLSGQMRKGAVVARLGGDEFAVLCPRTSTSDATAIATRLVEAVSGLRFHAAEQSLRVGCSIGVATFPTHARTAEDLTSCADSAMYEAKRGGKNSWAVFRDDPDRLKAEATQLNWNALIQRALQEERFVLLFQPVHRAADMSLAHHEALIRMIDETDPERLISPTEFISNAVRSGKIRQIDRWVMSSCVQALAAADPSRRLSANLSARSLEDSSFPAFLQDLFQRHDVDPRRLHIELAEASAVSDPTAARQFIDALRELGCSVHLDDFGSGFHSLTTLKHLPVDAIKMDGALVRNLLHDSSTRLFVAAMVEIAHDLNKLVIAEHVEDAATLDVLRAQGVDLVQGFHLGRPAAAPARQVPPSQPRALADRRDEALGTLA